MIRSITTTLVLLTFCINLNATSKKLTRQEYIDQFCDAAVEEMNTYRIPASITLAQGILESGNGNSSLATKEKNHFGIKCGKNWKGKSGRYTDDAPNECFRAYKSAHESYRDHSKFLTENQRYGFLFDYDVTNYKSWAKGLKKAGYATDPKYANRLIDLIEDNDLDRFDKMYKKGSSRRSTSGRKTISSGSIRNVSERNGILSTLSSEGDSYEKIARDAGLDDWQIYKYNDTEKGQRPNQHAIVYLESKNNKAPKGHETYTLKGGESLWNVSQKYGIKLSKLYRLNRMSYKDRPVKGQVIYLRHKKPRR